MTYSKEITLTIRKFGYGTVLLATLLLTTVTLAQFSGGQPKIETIDATAMGTSTQLGKNVSVKVIITSFPRKRTEQSWSMPSRRAKTRAW